MLSIWLILSILYQIQVKTFYDLHKYNMFYLIPTWSFFSKLPDCNDIHIAYSQVGENQSVGIFKEVRLYRSRGSYFVWNPWKRSAGTLMKLLESLLELSNQKAISREEIVRSTYYKTILDYLLSLRTKRECKQIQFILFRAEPLAKPDGCPRVVFVSEIHKT